MPWRWWMCGGKWEEAGMHMGAGPVRCRRVQNVERHLCRPHPRAERVCVRGSQNVTRPISRFQIPTSRSDPNHSFNYPISASKFAQRRDTSKAVQERDPWRLRRRWQCCPADEEHALLPVMTGARRIRPLPQHYPILPARISTRPLRERG